MARADEGGAWLPWLVVGGGAVAAAIWWHHRPSNDNGPSPHREAANTNAVDRASMQTAVASPPVIAAPSWIYPVPMWMGRRAEVSDHFSPTVVIVDGKEKHRKHLGVDVMFRRRARNELIAEYPPGSPDASLHYFVPPGHPAVAVADGVIWSVAKTARGWGVVVSHGAPWATFYQHLETIFVAPTKRGANGQRVRAGEPLGVIGGDPSRAPHLRHLHFAAWYRGGGDDAAVDPGPLLDRATHIPAPIRRAEAA